MIAITTNTENIMITEGRPVLPPILVMRIDRGYKQLNHYLEVAEGYHKDNVKPPPEYYEQVGSLRELFIISLIYTLRSIGYKADYYSQDIEFSVRVGVKLSDDCHVTVWDGSHGYRMANQYRIALYTPWDYEGKKVTSSPLPRAYREAGVLVNSIAEVLEHLYVIATTMGLQLINTESYEYDTTQ